MPANMRVLIRMRARGRVMYRRHLHLFGLQQCVYLLGTLVTLI